jgi:hypothetical protein
VLIPVSLREGIDHGVDSGVVPLAQRAIIRRYDAHASRRDHLGLAPPTNRFK